MDQFASSAVEEINRYEFVVNSSFILFQQSTLTALNVFSAMLGENFNEEELEKSEIENIRIFLQQLKEESKEENDDVREFIDEEIKEVNKDIHQYSIKGGKAFQASVERMIGKLVANRGLFNSFKNEQLRILFQNIVLSLVELAKKALRKSLKHSLWKEQNP